MLHDFLATSRRQAWLAIVGLGLALGASGAQAQAVQTPPAPDAAQPQSGIDVTARGDPDAVVIHGQRHHTPPTYHGSSADAEAASRDAAWRNYRDSTPNPTPGSCSVPPDPSQDVGCNTLEGSKDYPGLHTIGQ
jgi:hypothetical protein